MKAKITAATFAIISILTLPACGQDANPGKPDIDTPVYLVVIEKRIDPPVYRDVKECATRVKTKCTRYKTVRKVVDDRDYILVTIDNNEHDVSEEEYNSVNVGGLWQVD